MNDKVKRNSNIELLRVLAIIGIIFHHYVQYGVMKASQDISLIENLWLRFINGGGGEDWCRFICFNIRISSGIK